MWSTVYYHTWQYTHYIPCLFYTWHENNYTKVYVAFTPCTKGPQWSLYSHKYHSAQLSLVCGVYVCVNSFINSLLPRGKEGSCKVWYAQICHIFFNFIENFNCNPTTAFLFKITYLLGVHWVQSSLSIWVLFPNPIHAFHYWYHVKKIDKLNVTFECNNWY